MRERFCWTEKIPTWNVFQDSLESIKEDKHRLYAALFAQGIHLTSDQYTKMGLPVPFLSLLDADVAYKIYKEGYDYLDYLHDSQIIKRTLKSAAQSVTINLLIGALHKFYYNPEKDFDQKLYNARTRKIILYSNLFATTSDVIQTSIRTYIGDDNAIKDFDLGGFLITMYRIITDTDFILKVKEEFIFNEWDRIIESKNNIFSI
jgi:ORF30